MYAEMLDEEETAKLFTTVSNYFLTKFASLNFLRVKSDQKF